MGLEEKAAGFDGMASAGDRGGHDSLWNVLAGEEAADVETGCFCYLVWLFVGKRGKQF